MSTLLNGIDILGIKFIIRWFEYLLIPFLCEFFQSIIEANPKHF